MTNNGDNKETLDEIRDKITTEKVEPLEKRVKELEEKCEYEKFQDNVEKIVLKTLGNDEGRTKIKEHAKESAKEYNEEQGWKNKQFWIPTIIGIAATIGTILLAIKAFSSS